ncbi:MAG: hypothetical protein AAF587_33345 [Bacteroidota bacterium]
MIFVKTNSNLKFWFPIFLRVILFLSLPFQTQAAIWSVDNNSNNPAHFTTIQAAIDSAQSGDTILVAPSSNPYGFNTTITINKKIVLIGAGYDNLTGGNTILHNLEFVNESPSQGASGSYLSGLRFQYNNSIVSFKPDLSGGSLASQQINDVIIERCYLLHVRYYGGAPGVLFKNHKLINCRIEGDINLGYSSSANINLDTILISNNLFNSSAIRTSSSSAGQNTVFVRNNDFINNGYAFYSQNIVVANNIFYSTNPGNPSPVNSCPNCAFINNLTFGYSNDTLPTPGGIGSGNIIGQDPLFVNYSSDLTLSPGSPAINAGSDGTDIGISGGSYPFDVGAPPRIPHIQLFDVPNSAIPINGFLPFELKAKTHN